MVIYYGRKDRKKVDTVVGDRSYIVSAASPHVIEYTQSGATILAGGRLLAWCRRYKHPKLRAKVIR